MATRTTTKKTEEQTSVSCTVRALRKCYYGGIVRNVGALFVYESKDNIIPNYLELVEDSKPTASNKEKESDVKE